MNFQWKDKTIEISLRLNQKKDIICFQIYIYKLLINIHMCRQNTWKRFWERHTPTQVLRALWCGQHGGLKGVTECAWLITPSTTCPQVMLWISCFKSGASQCNWQGRQTLMASLRPPFLMATINSNSLILISTIHLWLITTCMSCLMMNPCKHQSSKFLHSLVFSFLSKFFLKNLWRAWFLERKSFFTVNLKIRVYKNERKILYTNLEMN